VHGLSQFKLPNEKKQEKHTKAFGTYEVLQVRQKDDLAQRNKVV
jgi:hypothetical protein